MQPTSKKVFSKLDLPFLCEHKTSVLPAASSGIFHNHDGYELLLFLEGEAIFFSEEVCFSPKRGDLILIPPFTFHRVEQKEQSPYDRVLLNLREELLQELSSDITDLSTCFSPAGYRSLSTLHLSENTLTELLQLTGSLEHCLYTNHFGNDVLAKSYLVQFMVLLNRMVPQRNTAACPELMPLIVSNTFAYIEAHLLEEITLSALAKSLHHNGDYISRCFKHATGLSLQQFIITKRLTLAQKLLRKGLSPGDACEQSGFHNYCNFSRTFSKHIGCSPRQYANEKEHITLP